MSRTGTPPFARIAAELRDRIQRGELAPGDRVPSTREITAEWGVAMATATRALTTLRQDGLVQAVPGVGTIVSAGARPGAGRSPNRAVSTTRDGSPARDGDPVARIVTAAVAVAGAEGLAGLSMRRVAAEIGSAPMSLYRHVADKDDLLLHMMQQVLGQRALPDTAPGDWRTRLEIAARMLWSAFREHPWLAPAMSVTRPQPLPAALPYTEWVLTALDGHGLDTATMFTANITLFSFVRGTAVNLELEAQAEAESGMDSEEWMDAQLPTMEALARDGRFPMFARLAATGYDFSLDTLFEFGLQRLLDGFATLIESAGSGPSAGQNDRG